MDIPEPYRDGNTYEKARYVSKGGQMLKWREAGNFRYLLEEMGLEEGDTVMEVGAGTGVMLEGFKDHYTIALDISEGMLEIARSNNRADEYVLEDVMDPSSDLPEADHVFSSRVLHLVGDMDLVDRLYEQARKSVAFDFFNRNSMRWVSKKLMELENSLPGKNTMPPDNHRHTHREIDEYISNYGEENILRYSDFPLNYGVQRKVEYDLLARGIDRVQDDLGWFFRETRFPDLNTVGYRGIRKE